MTAQAYQATAQDGNVDSSVAIAGIGSGFPNEITTNEPPGAGINAVVNTVVKSAIADEIPTKITPHVNDVINTESITESIYKNDTMQKEPEIYDFRLSKNEISPPKNINTQPALTDAIPANESDKHNGLYAIQVGSFSMEGNALGLSRTLSNKGYNPHIILTTTYKGKPEKQYRVLIGLFPSQETAVEEAYRYTAREKVSVYVIHSPVWRVNKSKMKTTEIVRGGVYVGYENMKQHKNL